MLKLGKTQTLTMLRETSAGAYLAEDREHADEAVLLPGRQIPAGLKPGDTVEVFLYKDSEDRLLATTAKPALELGGLALLEVADTSRIGAFLRWGLAKDLFLPFKEQTYRPLKGDHVLVSLYIDKSDRLAATMHVYERLRADSPYQANDRVTGLVYETSKNFGAFVAVDNLYSARSPKNEIFAEIHGGDVVHARVTKVLEDGRLNLSLRDKGYLNIYPDSGIILEKLKAAGGSLPFHDKSDPAEIQAYFGISKNSFKKAIGHLMKSGRITLDDTHIELKN